MFDNAENFHVETFLEYMDREGVENAREEKEKRLRSNEERFVPHRFEQVTCAQCRQSFGPRSAGFATCVEHAGIQPISI